MSVTSEWTKQWVRFRDGRAVGEQTSAPNVRGTQQWRTGIIGRGQWSVCDGMRRDRGRAVACTKAQKNGGEAAAVVLR